MYAYHSNQNFLMSHFWYYIYIYYMYTLVCQRLFYIVRALDSVLTHLGICSTPVLPQ